VPDALKLVVGLGNPGPEYAATRHNAGFWYVNELARQYSLTFKYDKKFAAELCRINSGGIDCWLCKPQTFMNESGYSVQALSNFYKIEPHQILVAHDELDLDAGTVRLKKAGGHGGHNGLRHIIQQMSGNGFMRLRIGIGHPGTRENVTPYVLGRPSVEDESRIRQAIETTLSHSTEILTGHVTRVMNALNKKPATTNDVPEKKDG